MPLPETVPPRITATLAGHSFRDRDSKFAFQAEGSEGMPLTLVRDHANKFDMFAVKVIAELPSYPDTWIGFLDRASAELVGQFMDRGVTFSCVLSEWHDHNRHTLEITPHGDVP